MNVEALAWAKQQGWSPSRLELLALEVGIPSWELEAYLRREIERRRSQVAISRPSPNGLAEKGLNKPKTNSHVATPQ